MSGVKLSGLSITDGNPYADVSAQRRMKINFQAGKRFAADAVALSLSLFYRDFGEKRLCSSFQLEILA